MRAMLATAILAIALAGGARGAEDEAASFFDDSTVKEIRLYFTDSGWYNSLYQSHLNDPDDPYFPARFKYGDTELAQIGVRFKGNSSFRNVSTVKKSFKLDFNEYVDGATFLGLKKLNLNNLDLEPDMIREKMFLDFAGKYIAAMRAVHVKVYVNDAYYGLYLAVEQPDKTMMKRCFGENEDGNLFNAGEQSADLSYRGTTKSAYSSYYTLETNETADDWSDLIEFISVLNNTAAASLPAALEPICDTENMLYGIALNILFSNVDSYAGSASEFYLYDRTDTGRFVHIHWDLNEGFGLTGDGSPRVADPMTMSAFWLPTSSGMPGGSTARPLMEKLWAVDVYKRQYLRQLARMLREGFNPADMAARVTELSDRIRTDVYADPNKIYSNAQFETALNSAVKVSQNTIYGLNQFVAARYNYLRPILNGYAEATDLRLNELVVSVGTSGNDESGEGDPWIEIYNPGPGPLALGSYYLTDSTSDKTRWALPAVTLADGEYLVLWLDGETAEGSLHANFTPSATGGSIFLYCQSGTVTQLIDSLAYPALGEDQAMIRVGDHGSLWLVSGQPTPGEDNPVAGSRPGAETALLRINEFMADNQASLADPDEDGSYDDWMEIYNPGATAVDMSGMFVTDNMANPTKWEVPSGTTVPAGGYLVLWADADPEQGARHTDFQLDSDGEELAIFAKDGSTLIDAVVFPAQKTDVSYGRRTDDVNHLSWFDTPTPGAANLMPAAAWLDVSGGGAATVSTYTSEGDLYTGYATVTAESGFTPYGLAVFRYLQNGVVASEVGIPVAPPTTGARIFIEAGTTSAAARTGGETLAVSTGLALANTGTASADLTFTLRGLDGATLATGHGSLAGGAHVSRFIEQLADIAPDFTLPEGFGTAIGYCTLEVSSTQAVSLIAMRVLLNQREEYLLATTPVADLADAPASGTVYLPQLADGGGLTSTIALLNTSDQAESGTMYFYNGTGGALAVTGAAGQVNSVAYTIPAKGAFAFDTCGTGDTTLVGSVQIVPAAGSAAPVASSIYHYVQNGILVNESGVPSAVPTTHARIYVDCTDGYGTGLAVAVPDDAAREITLTACGLDGAALPDVEAVRLTVEGRGYRAFYVDQVLGDLPDGFTGVLDIASASPVAALTLRTLYNERGDFLMTAFPVADLNQAAPEPLVFPQIAGGGGYTSQFIVMSAGGAGSTVLRLFDDAGSPLRILP